MTAYINEMKLKENLKTKGWKFTDEKIEKEYQLKDFAEALTL